MLQASGKHTNKQTNKTNKQVHIRALEGRTCESALIGGLKNFWMVNPLPTIGNCLKKPKSLYKVLTPMVPLDWLVDVVTVHLIWFQGLFSRWGESVS